jgi:hypothetical protein
LKLIRLAETVEAAQCEKAADRKSRGFFTQIFSWGGFQKLTVWYFGHTYLFIGSSSHFLSWLRMEHLRSVTELLGFYTHPYEAKHAGPGPWALHSKDFLGLCDSTCL